MYIIKTIYAIIFVIEYVFILYIIYIYNFCYNNHALGTFI